MKKQLLTAVVLLLSFTALAQTTPEKKESKLEFVINSKLGFAKLNQSGFVPLNGNISGADALLSFKMGKKWNLATGVGYMEFNANPTFAGNSASLKNTYLQIPIKAIGDFSIFNKDQTGSKIFLTIGAGLYANTLLKSEVETVSGNSDMNNLGWNFGLATQIGAKFVLSDALNIGIGLESQGDFNEMKKDGTEQKIEQINALYFNLGFTF